MSDILIGIGIVTVCCGLGWLHPAIGVTALGLWLVAIGIGHWRGNARGSN